MGTHPWILLLLSLPFASPHIMDCKILPSGPQLWKNVFLCGTELEQLSQVYDIRWDFSHLDEACQKGSLSASAGKSSSVYLFGQTEPQMVPDGSGGTAVVPVPVILAVETDVPLPSKLGLNSVQMSEEQVVDMSAYKMEWAPLSVPPLSASEDENRPPQGGGSPLKRRKTEKGGGTRFWSLSCRQRSGRGVTKNMKEERTRAFDYCMPYIMLPHKQEEEQVDTCVDVMVELPGRQAPLVLEFDWEMDELEEFVDEKAKEAELDESQRKALEKGIKDAVSASKKARKDKKEAKKAEIEAMPLSDREALKRIKVQKFYPKNELCAGLQSKYVNRYYGQADIVV